MTLSRHYKDHLGEGRILPLLILIFAPNSENTAEMLLGWGMWLQVLDQTSQGRRHVKMLDPTREWNSGGAKIIHTGSSHLHDHFHFPLFPVLVHMLILKRLNQLIHYFVFCCPTHHRPQSSPFPCGSVILWWPLVLLCGSSPAGHQSWT